MRRLILLTGTAMLMTLAGCASKELSLSDEIQHDSQFGRFEPSTAAPQADSVLSEPAGPGYDASYAARGKQVTRKKARIKKAAQRPNKRAKRRARSASSVGKP